MDRDRSIITSHGTEPDLCDWNLNCPPTNYTAIRLGWTDKSQTNWYNLFSQDKLELSLRNIYASPCDLISNKCESWRVWGVWRPTHCRVTGHFLIWVTSPTLTAHVSQFLLLMAPWSQMACDGAEWDVTTLSLANQNPQRRGIDQSEAGLASVIARCHVSQVTICCDTHYLSQMSRRRHQSSSVFVSIA